jgi:hypothetical protein
MARTQPVINEQGHPKKIEQGVETIAGDGHETTTTMISLRKSQLASQAKTIEEMITATTNIEVAIETSQVPAGGHISPGRGSSRSLR